MRLPAFEPRWRDGLLDATIPAPGDGLPAMATIDRGTFWPRFDATASLTLRLGFRVATILFVGVVPLVLGYGRVLHRLDPARQDAVLRRAAALPGIGALLEVVKIVACFAYFDNDGVQRHVQDRGAP
jgi:hypothetical protein